MRKKRKRLNKIKVIFFILIVIFIIYLCNCITHFGKKYLPNIFNSHDSSNYEIIKQDKNENYLGIGKQLIENKDGYFTIFTTTEKNKKTYKEYKQNGNSSWANNTYWGGTMSENGCGITSISVILSGYNKNYTPEQLREKYYPVLDSEKISKELSSTFKIKNTDFYYDDTHLSKTSLTQHLQTNRPILICVWNKPSNNRWTSASHYMVLLATDGDDMVYVSNPNRS